jgi:hypothetical protein
VTAHETAGSPPGATITFGAVERRLLAAMPLHAITACYGEGGLRERLLIEVGRLPAADRCGVVTPPARHAASLPFELRDAREPLPICIVARLVVGEVSAVPNGPYDWTGGSWAHVAAAWA